VALSVSAVAGVIVVAVAVLTWPTASSEARDPTGDQSP
jgi:hypothetical protein